ncbi:Uncharacterised protein [Streptococcus pneumoniae]|nr:Uncharacterised protein [Streptococcus pneumoniae]
MPTPCEGGAGRVSAVLTPLESGAGRGPAGRGRGRMMRNAPGGGVTRNVTAPGRGERDDYRAESGRPPFVKMRTPLPWGARRPRHRVVPGPVCGAGESRRPRSARRIARSSPSVRVPVKQLQEASGAVTLTPAAPSWARGLVGGRVGLTRPPRVRRSGPRRRTRPAAARPGRSGPRGGTVRCSSGSARRRRPRGAWPPGG